MTGRGADPDRRPLLARDAEIGAFVHLMSQAHATESPAAGAPPLAGVTVGVKDVIETVDAPTALGSEHYAGRRTGRDAAVVALLRQAGAVIVGKTTTAEFAYRDAPATRNPLDLARTPGGSSSGSAAAVAAGMVQVALATQTGGSIIRPAAFCGVVGYKPTFGLVPTSGVMQLAPSFDTVGLMARDVVTVARTAQVVAGLPLPGLPERPPRVGVLPAEDLADCEPEMVAGLRRAETVITGAGGDLLSLSAPVDLGRLRELHQLVNAYEGARSLAGETGHCRPQTAGLIARGHALAVEDYRDAVQELEALRPTVDAALGQVDVLLLPAASGWPPAGQVSTGDSSYCQPWSAARAPAITVPLRPRRDSLPVGIQLVAARWQDVDLLAWAGWLERALTAG